MAGQPLPGRDKVTIPPAPLAPEPVCLPLPELPGIGRKQNHAGWGKEEEAQGWEGKR